MTTTTHQQQQFFAKRLFDGEQLLDNVRFTVVNGSIESIDIGTQLGAEDTVLESFVVPGFVDLQVNGGGGVLLNSSPTVEGIRTMMAAHAKFGTTAMLPTLITDKVEVMAAAAEAIAEAIASDVAGIKGIHFEGPHLSVAKKGAHSAEFIRPISEQEWQVLSRRDIGKVIVTLAPENVLPSDIKKMVSLGIKVCLGHSNADAQTAQKAIEAGADGFTHLYNAMSPLTGRAPGMVGCALQNDSAACGIIVDGHHVAFESCQLAEKIKPNGKLFLVTDAMPPVGTDEQEFNFFDRKVTLADGKLTSTTGELAGSVLDMATAVRNCHHHMKVPLTKSLQMASLFPAQYINESPNIGKLSVGSSADFVLLNDELYVEQTWVAGTRIV